MPVIGQSGLHRVRRFDKSKELNRYPTYIETQMTTKALYKWRRNDYNCPECDSSDVKKYEQTGGRRGISVQRMCNECKTVHPWT